MTSVDGRGRYEKPEERVVSPSTIAPALMQTRTQRSGVARALNVAASGTFTEL
jgi:hypothetical protein